MAASFMTLPREVRYQIYGHLCDEKCGVELMRHMRSGYMEPPHVENAAVSGTKQGIKWLTFVKREDPPQDLFALLRTCRQVLQETIFLLYAQAVFCFYLGDLSSYRHDYSSWHNHRFFPEQSFQMVQQFHIIMKENLFRVNGSDLEDVLAYFKNGSALRRLTLEFQFLSDAYWCGKSCHAWMEALSANTAIPKMIAALNSLHYFQILMNDYNPDMEGLIAPFVQQVETTLGAAHDSERRGFCRGRRLGTLQWTWHLRRALDNSSEATQ